MCCQRTEQLFSNMFLSAQVAAENKPVFFFLNMVQILDRWRCKQSYSDQMKRFN